MQGLSSVIFLLMMLIPLCLRAEKIDAATESGLTARCCLIEKVEDDYHHNIDIADVNRNWGASVGYAIITIGTAWGTSKDCKITVSAPDLLEISRRTENEAVAEIKTLIAEILPYAQASAVEIIEKEESSRSLSTEVYNASGILVKSNATDGDVRILPAGLYIVGGKKIIVK